MLNQFDVVRLLTTKRIKYMSGPPGMVAHPQGNWSVVGFINTEALLAKDNTTIRIPITDVIKVASYNIDSFMSMAKNAGYLNNKDRKYNHGKKATEENRIPRK